MEQRALRTPSPLLHISVVRVGCGRGCGQRGTRRRAWSGTERREVKVLSTPLVFHAPQYKKHRTLLLG